MTAEEIVQAVTKLSEAMSRPVYRGQANVDWEPQSGAVRRLRNSYGDDFPTEENQLRSLVNQYHKENLIIPMAVIDGDDLNDLQRLSILQHHGAATGLLDFTENPLLALWFACKEEPDKDATIFVLDIGDPLVARNSRALTNNSNPFDAGIFVMYHEPDHALGARIIAQQSVFVVCNPFLPNRHLKSVLVPQKIKGPMWDYLTRLGLSEATLFADIPGLADANRASKQMQSTGPLTPSQHRDRGNRAFQAGRYEDALASYESYATVLSNVAQPYCLMGDTLSALGQFEEAGRAYTKALENLDRPIYVEGQVIVSPRHVGNIMSRTLYYNRGNTHAAADVNGGGIMLHRKRPVGPVAAVQNCTTCSPLSVWSGAGDVWRGALRSGTTCGCRGGSEPS